MNGKDILTLLLVAYDFKEINITTYRGVGNSQGYNIYAYNKDTDESYNEENCEGLMFNIVHLIDYMKDRNIEPTYSPFNDEEYSVKEILQMFNNKSYKE